MQEELRAAKPDLNIEIVGINGIEHQQWNHLITPGRKLSWLQDTDDQEVWNRWQVTWRDVFVVDAQNQVRGIYNLTQHTLAEADNRDTLKQMFLEAATAKDIDGDGLPDDWESLKFGDLLAGPTGDQDGDGRDNFAEFAFGTDPANAKSNLAFTTKVRIKNSQPYLEVKCRQRAGAFLDYFVETSNDLVHWTTTTAEDLSPPQPPRNLFDGTGTLEVTYSFKEPVTSQSAKFLRVSAVPRPRL